MQLEIPGEYTFKIAQLNADNEKFYVDGSVTLFSENDVRMKVKGAVMINVKTAQQIRNMFTLSLYSKITKVGK